MEPLDQKLEKAAQQMSDFFQKSTEMKKLYETIQQLGPEGLKKAAPKLTPAQRELLVEVLQKGKPAVSMDDQMPEGGVKVRQIQSEKVRAKGHDEEDEKLVKEEAAEHKHQGDSSPEGFTGQKIEDPAPGEKGKQDKKPGPDPVKKAANPDAKEDAELAEKVESLVEAHEDEAEASEEKEMDKAVAVGGGSRGGRITGYSKTGKPIYSDPSKPESTTSTAQEATDQEAKDEATKRKLRIRGTGSMKDVKTQKSASEEEESEKEVEDPSLKKSDEKPDKKEFPPKKEESEEKKPEMSEDNKNNKEDSPPEQQQGQYSDDILSKMIQGMKARGMQRGMAMEKFYANGYDMNKMYKMWDGMQSEPEAGAPQVDPKEDKNGPDSDPKDSKDDKKEFPPKKMEKAMQQPLAIKPANNPMQPPLTIKPESKEMQPPLTGEPPANAGGEKGEDLCDKCGQGNSNCVCKERKAQKEEIKTMEKSIKWKPKNLLIASTRRGQNAHYEVADLIEKGEKQIEDLKKSKGYFESPYEEKLVKSEGAPKETSINDMIEKGHDRTEKQAEAETRLQKAKEPKFTPNSFSDTDLISVLSPKEFKSAQESMKKK